MSSKLTAVPVPEQNYAETMKTKVEPFLAERRKDGTFPGWDGNAIHYESYLTPEAEGTVVISHGFTESAEKFREMSYNFITMGYNVFAIDHRGHGLSYRKHPEKYEIVTVDAFDEYVKDFHIFVTGTVQPAVGDSPLYLYAHSMGGAVAIQYLQTHPGVFKKAVLSAPMVQAASGPLSPGATKALCSVFCAIGKRDDMVFIHHGFQPDRTWETSNDTSKARFDYYHAKRCAEDKLKTASASYSWVREAMRVIKKNLDPARNKNITIPVLLCQPEEDGSVVSEKENVFIDQLSNGRLVRFPASRHEIYASGDETLLTYLKTIQDFLADA